MAQFGEEESQLELIRVTDEIYVIYNEYIPGNVTALITDEGVLLVDSKYEIDHTNIINLLSTVTSQPVIYVVNTHYHQDHSGGNLNFQNLDARVFSSENARRKLTETNYLQGVGRADITFEDKTRIYIGDTYVDLYHFGRSHTDGDIVVHFPEQRVIATGDMFTFGDQTPQLIDYNGGGSARDWSITLEKALQLDFDLVIPGHGRVTDEIEMRNFMENTILLRTRVMEMLSSNMSREEISEVLVSDFNWTELHLFFGLDGLIGELKL
jgi:cyclase